MVSSMNGAVQFPDLVPEGVLSGLAARERTLPVHPALRSLFPQGNLQRGAVVGCTGLARWSLALGVAAAPAQEGAWVCVAGAGLGLRATAEAGVALERLVLVAEPSTGFTDRQWADVVATMIDGFDVVLLGAGAQRVRAGAARRLQARAQSRGAVLVVVGPPGSFACDYELVAAAPVWEGLGSGHGVAQARLVRAELRGRRMPRPRQVELWLPNVTGQAQAVEVVEGEITTVTPLRRTG